MAGGFFSFHSLISTTIVKVVYVLGMLLITILSMLQLLIAVAILIERAPGPILQVFVVGDPILQIIISTFMLFFGNLFWRLICEVWILLFSIHEILASIEAELRERR